MTTPERKVGESMRKLDVSIENLSPFVLSKTDCRGKPERVCVRVCDRVMLCDAVRVRVAVCDPVLVSVGDSDAVCVSEGERVLEIDAVVD